MVMRVARTLFSTLGLRFGASELPSPKLTTGRDACSQLVVSVPAVDTRNW